VIEGNTSFFLDKEVEPMKKCYTGKPVEFKAKYEGIVIKLGGGPDTSPVYGLKMTKFSWLAPNKIHIGKGFYVKPELPYGITHYGPASSYDLELIVTGPGLPKNGQKVMFKWGLSPCRSVATDTICKQFMNMEVVKSKSGSSEFTIEFHRGYTEQQYIVGWNVATWTICYDGPFEMVILAPLPNMWEIAWMPSWILDHIKELKKSGDAPGAELLVKPLVDTIDGTITKLAEIPVPEDQKRLYRKIIESLEQSKAEVSEADSLVKRSNGVASEGERLKLRAVAIDHLERAHHLNSKAIELFSRFEEALERKH